MKKVMTASYLVEELERANSIYGTSFHSPQEGYAVMLEEMDELWAEIKKKRPDKERIREEATQVGAMAIKFLMSMEEWPLAEHEGRWDPCDDCDQVVPLNTGHDYFIERGIHGLSQGERSKMVCRRCYKTKYAGKEKCRENY